MRMRNIGAIVTLVFVSICGHAQISGSSSRPLIVQNNGSTVGTATGQRVLNFASGCTPTYSGGVFNITCSGGANITVNGGSSISSPVNFQNGSGNNIITFQNPSGSNIQAGITNGTITNSMLANPGTTVSGQNCVLGSSCTPTLDAIGSPQSGAAVSFTQSAQYGYTFLGTAPASTSSGTGTAAGTLFNVTAPAGGATTGSATTAGAGGSISYTAGAGGSGSGGTNASGGAGGNINLIPGAGGAKSGSGTAGAAGVVNVEGGLTVSGTCSGCVGSAGFFSSTQATVSGGGTNIGTANEMVITPYYLSSPTTITNLLWRIQVADASASDSYDICIYDTLGGFGGTGNLKADTGALTGGTGNTWGSSGQKNVAIAQTSVTLPGNAWYVLAFTGTTTTAQILYDSTASYYAPFGEALSFGSSSGGACPSTITVPSATWTRTAMLQVAGHD